MADQPAVATATEAPVPLFVDLDDTLATTDVTIGTMRAYAFQGPMAAMRMLLWLRNGKSVAKAMIARALPINPANLSWKPEVIAAINAAKAEGRPVILASASHWRHVNRVSKHLGIFDDVIASSAKSSAKGRGKLVRILAMTNGGPFDYIGDARADIPIWAAARKAFSVGYCPADVIKLG